MIPFLFFELTTIITCLLEIIVQLEVIESCKCARQPKEINLTDKAKLLPVEKINNCFSVDVVVNKLKRSNAITSQINELKKGTQLFVITMLSKLFERSPLGSAVLQCVFLTHQECQYFQEKSCMRNAEYFWDVSLTLKRNKATNDFKSFLAEDLSNDAAKFQSFSAVRDRLEHFYFSTIQILKYQEFSFVLKLLLTLSRGQVSVERGFSLNNNILKTNMVLRL